MSDNFVQDGEKVEITAAAAVESGDLVHVGNGLFGVAETDIENAAKGTVNLEGIFTVPKDGTDFSTSLGLRSGLCVNSTSLAVTTATAGATAATNIQIMEAALAAATTVKVKLV